jgi:hypothetical protein
MAEKYFPFFEPSHLALSRKGRRLCVTKHTNSFLRSDASVFIVAGTLRVPSGAPRRIAGRAAQTALGVCLLLWLRLHRAVEKLFFG